MSIDRTMSGINNAANAMQSAQARLRVAVAQALLKEVRAYLPARFQPGAVERFGYPPYAASTLARKTTPPLVESGLMRQRVLQNSRIDITPSNQIILTVSGPHYMKIQYDAGRDFIKPQPHELKRIIQRARVLPHNRFATQANITPNLPRSFR